MAAQNVNSSSCPGLVPDSSADVASSVTELLRTSPYRSLHDVHCEVDCGTLVLRGRVPSFYLKQLAQELVRKTDGVWAIVNEVEVEP